MKIKLFITVVLLNCFVITNASNFENHKIITAKTISPITASNSGDTCEGSSFNLYSTSAGSDYIYSWTGPNGFTSNQQNPIVTPFGAGTFTYTVTATNGIIITETASTTITIYDNVFPAFPIITTICQGSPAPFLPNTSANGVVGTWSPSTIDTNTIGIQIFTFTPYFPEYCALSVVMNVEVVANPIFSTPSNVILCGNNGYGIFNLTALNPQISVDPNVSIAYYPSLADAFANTNVILNPQFYTNTEQFIQTLGIRITNAAGCYSITTLDLTVNSIPEPIITTQNNNHTICVDYFTNQVVSPLLLEVSNLPPGNYTYQWFADGLALPNGSNSTYLVEYPLSDSNQSNFSVIVTNENCAGTSNYFIVTQSGQASPVGIGYSIVNNAGNQTLTVEVNGYGIYNYSLDAGAIQESPVFANVAVGSHTISVYDTEGCGALLIENVEVNELPIPPPTGNSSQSFLEGATLADIIIEGENIQWYDSQNPNADKNTLENTLLPLTTVLVNGTTYFASQKIGGYESINRLPVTVTTTLNNSEFVTSDFYFSPNPVINNLAIKFKKNIKNIAIYNTLGQLVLSENGDFLNETILDLSYLNSGYYLVKLENETEKFTLKIVKK